MSKDLLSKILAKLDEIEERMAELEETTAGEMAHLHTTIEVLNIEQRHDTATALHRLDAKMTALLEIQNLNVEFLKFTASDSIQH